MAHCAGSQERVWWVAHGTAGRPCGALCLAVYGACAKLKCHADRCAGYYGEAASGGAASRFRLTRTRGAVEDGAVRRLAGVEPYPASQVRKGTPLLELPEEELRNLCEQLA